MDLPDDLHDDLRARLRHAVGQVRAVERMVAEGSDCREIVTQLSAARRALEQVGFRLVSAEVSDCLVHPELHQRDGERLEDLERLFLRLR